MSYKFAMKNKNEERKYFIKPKQYIMTEHQRIHGF